MTPNVQGGNIARTMTRRRFLTGSAAVSTSLVAGTSSAQPAFRFGLTPVFLDNDAIVVEQIRSTLATAMGRPIELLQRRTYQEVTALLLEGAIDAAWLCGYPFLRWKESLSLVAIPVWQGRPLYRSYLIAARNDPAHDLASLEGGIHAFSDPDSNSGWLVTASDLARMNQTPDSFFRRTIFTDGHRNVVRAVANGLTRSGSVDGYVWEVLSQVEPDLAGRTRVVSRSEWFGFPPIVCRSDRVNAAEIEAFSRALLTMQDLDAGRVMLRTLHLDGFARPELQLFDGIAARMAEVGPQP